MLNGQIGNLAAGVDDDGDAVQGHGGLLQAGGLLLVLQGPGGQADIGGAVLHGLDAGAGAGGVISDGDAGVVGSELLLQSADDLVHRSGAVGGHGAGESGAVIVVLRGVIALLAAAGQDAQCHDDAQGHGKKPFHFFRISFRFNGFWISSVQFIEYGPDVKPERRVL